MRFEIHHADVREWAKRYEGPKHHAALLDPPYELSFMGKNWDGTGVSFQPETWAALGEHLHPGAFLMAFAGTRGYHRMACAIEDAGFILHPVMVWNFATGFPKATRIDTQIDKGDATTEKRNRALRFTEWMRSTGVNAKQLDAATSSFMGSHYLTSREQAAIPTTDMFSLMRDLLPAPPRWVEDYVHQRTVESKQFAAREVLGTRKQRGSTNGVAPMNVSPSEVEQVTEPATDLAKAWAGHRYGLQALKPAVEMICVAQKPYTGRPVDCITATGAGALNVDAGRIGPAVDTRRPQASWPHNDDAWEPHAGVTGTDGLGRWPANFCTDETTSALLDAQSGYLHGSGNKADRSVGKDDGYASSSYEISYAGRAARDHNDSGGASRFFFRSDWNAEVEEALANAEPVKYAAKASTSEREAGCDRLPVQDWMQGHTAAVPQRDERSSPGSGNHHPTLKPLALVSWLSKLLLPPIDYAPRRILIPFAGVMSEAMGAAKAGFEEITCIEQDAEYIRIGQARIRHHLGMLAEVQVLGGFE